MSEPKKEYIEVYCPKSKAYGLITAQEVQGTLMITNFYGIDEESAAEIKTSHEGAMPKVGRNLLPCDTCGGKTPMCCDKKRKCKVKSGELRFQCLYCSELQPTREAAASSGADFYFLLDESGSMTDSDRHEAADAVRSMVKKLDGKGNVFSLVAWGSNAGYVFRKEESYHSMSSALKSYERHTTGYGGSTAADIAFKCIMEDVASSTKPVRIIFVTDGYLDDEAAAINMRNELLRRGNNVEILAIGITGANQSTLAKIGTVPEFSRVVGGSSALTSTFDEIAAVLIKKGNNF